MLNNTISWILLSKKSCFAILTVFLYFIQLVLLLDIWYVAKSLLYSLFHQAFNLLVMLISLENLFQRSSIMKANSWVTCSSCLQLIILVVSIDSNLHMSSLTNSFSLLLFLTMDYFFSWINSFSTIMDTNRGIWSDRLWRFRRIKWLLNFSDLILRNIGSSTEFKS